jgi:hypothetical protein
MSSIKNNNGGGDQSSSYREQQHSNSDPNSLKITNGKWQMAKEDKWKKGIATCNLKGEFL